LTTFGNAPSQAETEAALRSPPRFLVLSGPENVGKFSFVKSLLDSMLDEADLLLAEPGPDGARQARPFLSDRPSFSPFRAVIIDDADHLSEPAQDSWLKICEEAPEGSCVVAVASDPFLLLPPLLSRVIKGIRWSPLSHQEMSDFASSLGGEINDVAARMACGRPGLYQVLCSPSFVSLHESVVSSILDPSMGLAVPSAIEDLKPGRSAARSAAALVVRRAALSMSADPSLRTPALSFLRLSSSMLRVPSANVSIHWMNAVASSLKM